MYTRLVLGLTLPLLASQTAPPADWRIFAPKDGSFTVAVPNTPKEKKLRVKLAADTVDVTLYSCDGAGDVTFVVGVTEYPDQAVRDNADRRLRHAQEAAVENAKGKLFHKKEITLSGYPGREVWIETADKLIHVRLFAVRQRLYQTMAIGPKEVMEENKEVAGFMDSFKLKKQ